MRVGGSGVFLHDVVAGRRVAAFTEAGARHLRAQQLGVLADRAPVVVLAHVALASCLIVAF